MSQYKGYYTAASSRGGSQEAAGNRFDGETARGESQEQDCTEYDNGDDGTEYDPGGTTAMFDQQLWRSNMVGPGKRNLDEADLHNGRVVDQVTLKFSIFVMPHLIPGSATSKASENIQWGIQQVFEETNQTMSNLLL